MEKADTPILSQSLQAAMENPGGSHFEPQRDGEHGRVDVPVNCHSHQEPAVVQMRIGDTRTALATKANS